MFAKKRARILLAACAATASLFIATAQAQQQVFVDNFNNGNVNNSDTIPGFWNVNAAGTGSATETNGAPPSTSGINLDAAPGNGEPNYPFEELTTASTESAFNFFQQPIIVQATGLGFTSGSTVNSLTEFNFGSAVLPGTTSTNRTEYDELSDFSLEILNYGNGNGQVLLGEKNCNATLTGFEKSTPYNYQFIGPDHGQSGSPYGTQNLTGQIRSVEFVLSSEFYYVSITADTSPTNPTPITSNYVGVINYANFDQPYNFTDGTTWAPGDPVLNVETQIGGSNGSDYADMTMKQLSVSQMTMTYNLAGTGNWFTASNWSGLVLDSASAATLASSFNINTPDYRSASATFPQTSSTSPTVVDFSTGSGTITIGTINFQSTNPYTVQGGIIQFATDGSAGQVNTYAGNQAINVGNIVTIVDPAVDFNAAAGASLSINTGQMLLPAMLNFNANVNGGTVTLSGGMTTNGPVTISAGPGTANFVESDFVLNGALTLNVAAGGTLNMNTFIDYNSTPEPLTMSGAGLATVGTLQYMPSVTVTGGTLRILASTTANNINQGASYINSLTISGGKLDLTNNDMVIDYSGSSPLTTIRGYLQSGALYSSTASLALGTALGYAEATEINQTSSFNGLPTDSTSLCIMYTYLGDLNLDGVVNSADYSLMVSGNGIDWHNGDLNYDGVKNADDWSLFNLGVAASNARGNINNLPAPEPESLAVLGVLGFGLLKRNRRQSI